MCIRIETRNMFIFNNFLRLKSTSDLTIEVNEQPIYVHKAVLKIRSLYFRTMFQSQYIENKQRYLQAKSTFLKIFHILFLNFVALQYIFPNSVIKHYHYSYVTFKTFLKYLYTGTINLSSIEDLLGEFVKYATYYSLSSVIYD